MTTKPPLLMYAALLFCFGVAMYLFGVALGVARYLLGLNGWLHPIDQTIVWYSGIPVTIGVALALLDLFVLLSHKRPDQPIRVDPVADKRVTVALTAFNDEKSVGEAVRDFRSSPFVRSVIVVSNASTDDTMRVAAEAGADTVDEPRQGYGHCVYRCFKEALARNDSELIVLCEGDMTFRAADIEKLLAYAPHADIVNGTRTVERLRAHTTQLTTFMVYGNLFVGKLLEAKHLGRATLTDVGTTYKLCRRDALAALLPHLDPAVNLEFNPHFLDRALEYGLTVVECPVTFHPRWGKSKGGNVNNRRALTVGVRMMIGIATNWKRAK
ncbi:glycosyltransferase [Roseiarcus fermentans]|uniref:glycosyltransferase n=1 Tax=Roseiarcus fermentans TaxID=1473586 RepID=UPI001AECBF95|nr:glycosyltransferase [Roseiarcus fermentans]